MTRRHEGLSFGWAARAVRMILLVLALGVVGPLVIFLGMLAAFLLAPIALVGLPFMIPTFVGAPKLRRDAPSLVPERHDPYQEPAMVS